MIICFQFDFTYFIQFNLHLIGRRVNLQAVIFKRIEFDKKSFWTFSFDFFVQFSNDNKLQTWVRKREFSMPRARRQFLIFLTQCITIKLYLVYECNSDILHALFGARERLGVRASGGSGLSTPIPRSQQGVHAGFLGRKIMQNRRSYTR